MGQSKEQLLELYEARGEPETFAAAKLLYEQALAEGGSADPDVLVGYGYLLDCHGRIALREAAAQYHRAVALDPGADKPRYQLIAAKAALGEPEEAVELYTERLARSPGDVREHRLLASPPATTSARSCSNGWGGSRRPRRPGSPSSTGARSTTRR
jgi:tetratricopeptide (TPR) repeat protein